MDSPDTSIRGQNFARQTDPPKALEYIRCNFSQASAIKGEAVRLWPKDDTPRRFAHCNLVNCEPPPGSTIDETCNTDLTETFECETVEFAPKAVTELGWRLIGHTDRKTLEPVLLKIPIKHLPAVYARPVEPQLIPVREKGGA